jgi:lipopolysaccharide export system protein LptA
LINKKILIQFFLILTIFLTCFIFYKLFFIDPIVELKNVENNQWKSKNLIKKGTNQMNGIVYNSTYLDDNNYIIKAEFGEFSADDPGLMILTNVTGTIFLKNSETIEISSKKARYDSVGYNTNFSENVLITFNDHQINSDNFDLFFDKKLSTIYNNIIYKNLNTMLHADKIDIDLITKNSKIYMFDKSKKIKAKILN